METKKKMKIKKRFEEACETEGRKDIIVLGDYDRESNLQGKNIKLSEVPGIDDKTAFLVVQNILETKVAECTEQATEITPGDFE